LRYRFLYNPDIIVLVLLQVPGKREQEGPTNNKLEVFWTVVPAIALSVLVVIGCELVYFYRRSTQKRINCRNNRKQFGWIMRYPGRDKQFGKNIQKYR
jgi:cytochrome c oxidase subunit 2